MTRRRLTRLLRRSIAALAILAFIVAVTCLGVALIDRGAAP